MKFYYYEALGEDGDDKKFTYRKHCSENFTYRKPWVRTRMII